LVLLFIIIVGGCIGLCNNIQELITLLSFFGLFILSVSVILIFFLPNVGVMNYQIIQGAWKGLYWHKNHFGLLASFINILFLINFINSISAKEKRKFAWGFLYIMSLLFIYKSDSVASYLTTLLIHGGILLALIWIKLRKKIRSYHYYLIIIIIALVSLVIFLNIDNVFGIFNRNSTLTGRIPMWSYLYNTYIVQRPIGGYGFNAFWYDEAHQVAVQQAAGYPDPIVISDNGFIDLLVNTGFIGLFLFLVFYFCVWWRSIKYAWKATNINGFFPIIFMSYTLIANISWSLLFENDSFIILIMITLLFCISRDKL
jgi:O-antigen ligase